MINQKNSLLALENFASLPPPKVSFEFFPTKSEEAGKSLWNTVKELEKLNPEFVSVTYGAGGSTREKTRDIVLKIKNETALKPAAHLTCVGSPKKDTNEIAEEYLELGIKRIVALRGDAPIGTDKYVPHPEGYCYANDLVEGLKKIGDFDISVACYPEKHPESESIEKDIEYLKRKQDAGANRAITQHFIGTDLYFSFVEKAQKAGITIPIIPGIIMIAGYKQLVNFSKKCAASVPNWVNHLLEEADEKPESRNIIAGIIMAEQCRILREGGVEQFHFYTLNRPDQAIAICRVLGIG